MKKRFPIALVVLDGFGYSAERDGNAIALASTPFLDRIAKTHPPLYLEASGEAVGLPKGTMGNSQVGHVTIGAGKRVAQPITLVSQAIASGTLKQHPFLVSSLQQLKQSGKTVHIMGLLSDAGVHSDIHQFFGFLDVMGQKHIPHIVIHPFLDGRDSTPTSARLFLQQLQDYIDTHLPHARIGSIQGRFYAMDRDENWQRTCAAYHMLTDAHLKGEYTNWSDALDAFYAQGITDEFIPPTRFDDAYGIKPEDGIVMINVRSERMRQITRCFVDGCANKCNGQQVPLAFFITPVSYGAALSTHALFEPHVIEPTLKQRLSKQGLTIYTIAESEKYAHVTYFFDGGREAYFEHETRVLIPSIKARDYTNYPCMSAPEITHQVCNSLKTNPYDFYLINYANADMVGHSGDMQATIRAIECLDKQLELLYDALVQQHGGILLITADHGNAEQMIKNGKPWTAHTTNKVPFYAISNHPLPQPAIKELADIADYIMQLVQAH